jgi:erythronate-4-phosphate dehydrogenase
MKIVADSEIPYINDYFGAYGELVLKRGRTITSDDVKDADILLVRSITPVDENLLANTRVKFVGSVTAGADHLDTKWLDEAGIVWSVAHGFNAPPVADYVISMIAALQKRGLLLRGWFGQESVKAAVIGVGNVGRLVALRLPWLNIDITLCDPIRAENEANHEANVVYASLDALSDLDLISLHVPLTKTGNHPTYHFIDKAFLKRQKRGCILLNASRGSVIHSQDLLQYGAHLRWCLDVWEHEPKINKLILEQALIATPHIAGYSIQSKIRGIDMIYRIACEKNIIEPQPVSPLKMPYQQLVFTGDYHHWQDIVLGIFNPMITTTMMRSLLLPSNEDGHLFDEMRNEFNYRYEFSYTKIVAAGLSDGDKVLLTKLGITL